MVYRATRLGSIALCLSTLIVALAACGTDRIEPALSPSEVAELVPEESGVFRNVVTTRAILSTAYLRSQDGSGTWFVRARIFVGLNVLGYTQGEEKEGYFLVDDRTRQVLGPCFPVPPASQRAAGRLIDGCS